MLWVHPNKSIMFGCNNQQLIYKKSNGSSTECYPSVTIEGDWWGFSNNGCPEIGCLANSPEKGLELGQRYPGTLIEGNFALYEIRTGPKPNPDPSHSICLEAQSGLILRHTGKTLYDNIHHELVPVVLDIAGYSWDPTARVVLSPT